MMTCTSYISILMLLLCFNFTYYAIYTVVLLYLNLIMFNIMYTHEKSCASFYSYQAGVIAKTY